jgi:methionyl-tRNA formyltransferase
MAISSSILANSISFHKSSHPMKVIFFGFQTWGHRTLHALLMSSHHVPLVITHPDSGHCYESIWNDSVKQLAIDHDVPVLESQTANTQEIIQACKRIAPDVIILSNWRTWLSAEVFNIPRFGTLNIHDALLPRYGGFAPINWSIINGESETGVTVHFVTEELDLGDILLQEKIFISQAFTATDVFYRSLPFFADLPLRALDLISHGTYSVTRQDRTQATFYHKRQEIDSLIDWSSTSLEVYNLIRAQSDPYPNAYSHYRGRKFRVKSAHLIERAYCGTVGRVMAYHGNSAIILCGRSVEQPGQGIAIDQIADEQDTLLSGRSFFKVSEYVGADFQATSSWRDAS